MFYYEVTPADKSYRSKELLTYCSDQPLKLQQIIVVMLRTKKIYAVVARQVSKPSFSVKPIDSATQHLLGPEYLQVADWMSKYYCLAIGTCLDLIMPPDFGASPPHEDKPPSHSPAELPPLTTQQTTTYKAIAKDSSRTHIIHGDTGTGKTRLYIEIAQQTLQTDKSVVVMTPEISLAPQLAEAFSRQFPNTHIVHSQMTIKERRQIWHKLHTDGPHVLIGPRSALFYPLKSIGAIIIDEFHDGAYKQEQSPRYNAIRASAVLARCFDAKLILGSATPPIEEYFYAVSKGAKVHRLTDPAIKNNYSITTHVVDMSKPEERTSQPLISNSLLTAIDSALSSKQQVLLFLNRRGTSRRQLCQSCGWTAMCDRCDINYTYHHDSHALLCHTCGQSKAMPHQCPDCSSTDLIFSSPGTKQIELALSAKFPQAKIGRYDKDNKKNDTFSSQYQSIKEGKVDILIGTQLLVKGHDLPRLGLVGVLFAENELKFPDFSSAERGFQLLKQIVGRVGRGHQDGVIIVQTFDVDHSLIDALEHKNDVWESFYSSELAHRKQFGFPPFRYLLKIECARASQTAAQKAAKTLHSTLMNQPTDLEISEPAPAFFEKRANKWHWQVVIKSTKRSDLIKCVPLLPANCTYDLDPVSLL